ncbi:MAG: hypothetical protein ABEI53_01465 [Candidatus Magasanikbacteria bacterium]
MMFDFVEKFDRHLIDRLRGLEVPFARFSIFVVYFWFGLLKLLGVSPAHPVVESLFREIFQFTSFSNVHFFLAVLEVAIGFLFVVKGLERIGIFLLVVHIIGTLLPLLFLLGVVWQSFLVPTFEGQYIIKNVLIASLAVVVGSQLVPLSFEDKK